MNIALSISPHRRAIVELTDHAGASGAVAAGAVEGSIIAAFAKDEGSGMLHLATQQLHADLPADLAFVREFASRYLTRLCHVPEIAATDVDTETQKALPAIAPPDDSELSAIAGSAPPMRGLEYLDAECLAGLWRQLDDLIRHDLAKTGQRPGEYLRGLNPVWRTVGRVTFHLAENKRDSDRPFAFLATYASNLSTQGRLQHVPLGQALREYAGAKNRSALLALLQPIQRATEKSAWVKELVDSGRVYSPLAWGPREAHQFLQDVPRLEESGLIVRVPDWWKPARPPRPVVNVTVGDRAKSKLDANALLDFSVNVALDGESLSESELQLLLQSTGGLIRLRGKWVEMDREKLAEALDHWKKVEREVGRGGISFFEAMRLLSGARVDAGDASDQPAAEVDPQWVGISAGKDLEKTLSALREPEALAGGEVRNLVGQLRPYQLVGVHWLQFLTGLGLGACLADDMGLGKTIQVIALLLKLKSMEKGAGGPSLLVAPASLLANWKRELLRFAPSLSVLIAHPSEWFGKDLGNAGDTEIAGCDLVITTYAMLSRLPGLTARQWRLAILDEAQAIKNSGTRQTRVVKSLRSAGRVALTGTPVENRLSDLWSLFDFLNPGLLGGAKAFTRYTKQLAGSEPNPYGPLRKLIRPYILRRLKTDRRIISDLPDKTEVNAYCGLSKKQAALYAQAVHELSQTLKSADGIQRRGVVLASLMRLKQICNHPAHAAGAGPYDPVDSGKFARLAEIGRELAQRQEKALVFTQFREMTGPLADFLAGIFERRGLVLHGQTPVARRQELVEAFGRDEGPPFFILSLKAGGVGLNLTAASHVIHFDRWWNPAVENQATDRAFRIGQKRNVLVHKFVCRGTVEERIDQLIAEKSSLSRDLLDGGGETMLTEMNDDQLLKFVALDIGAAMEE